VEDVKNAYKTADSRRHHGGPQVFRVFDVLLIIHIIRWVVGEVGVQTRVRGHILKGALRPDRIYAPSSQSEDKMPVALLAGSGSRAAAHARRAIGRAITSDQESAGRGGPKYSSSN